MPMTPFASPPTPAVEDTHEPAVETHNEYEGVAAEDLPFSAGIPPEKGMIGKINTQIDERLIESDQLRSRKRRAGALSGMNVLF